LRALPPPADDVESVLTLITRPGSVDEPLRHARASARLAENRYQILAQQEILHQITVTQTALAGLSAIEAQRLYDNRLVAGSGRRVYDRLLAAARGKCPGCCIRPAESLDHYLPKTAFPGLSVTPLNLVPCCHRCNLLKGEYVPTSRALEYLHPYFDKIDDLDWLQATVLHRDPPVTRFEIKTSAISDKVLCDRMQNHFAYFRLGRLYSENAASEMSSIAPRLRTARMRHGVTMAERLLREGGLTKEYSPSIRWLHVAYSAWIDDGWFINHV
jgi:hypothetical protein